MHMHMHGAMTAVIYMGGAVLLVITLGLVIIGIIRAVRTGGLSGKEKQSYADETRMIQDIFNSLSKMEERVETLETILIERKKQSHDPSDQAAWKG